MKQRQRPLATIWQRKWLDLEVTHSDVQKLANEARAFGTAWFTRASGCRMRVVVGSVGTGKSHVAKRLASWAGHVAYEAWVRHWNRSSSLPSVVCADWSQIASPETCDRERFERWMWTVHDASLVILDDVGTETDTFKSGIPVERLTHILNRCEGKFLWLNTNVSHTQWATCWDARVEDRLLAGQLIEVNAPSFRSERHTR